MTTIEGRQAKQTRPVLPVMAGLAGGLVLGIVGTAVTVAVLDERGSDPVDVTGTISGVNADGDQVAFVPDDESLLDDDDTMAGNLVNRTDAPVEDGQDFVGVWLPDEGVLIVTD